MTDYHSSQVNDLQTALDRMRAQRDRFQYIAHIFYSNRYLLDPDKIRWAADQYESAVRDVH